MAKELLINKVDEPYLSWYNENIGAERFEKMSAPFVRKGYSVTSGGMLVKRALVNLAGISVPVTAKTTLDKHLLIVNRPTTVHWYEEKEGKKIEEIVELMNGVGKGYVYYHNPTRAEHPDGLLINARRKLVRNESILLSGENPCAWAPDPKAGFVGIELTIIGGTIADLDNHERINTGFRMWDPYSAFFCQG